MKEKFVFLGLMIFLLVLSCSPKEQEYTAIFPIRTEVVKPIHKDVFREVDCSQRVQEGNPRVLNNFFQFDGALDGNRQVDPQIAVGGGYIVNGTNSGFLVYDKKGNYLDGIHQRCFQNGIDPKMFYDVHNKVFGFDLWVYWDSLKIKPVNISISETSNPLGAWNTYPVSITEAVDGGAIGYSKKWIAYSYPGGNSNTFSLKMSDAKAGKSATIYHFPASFGQPAFGQDAIDDLYFLKIEGDNFVITRITENKDGTPIGQEVSNKPHHLQYFDYPPLSPQKNTEQLTSSGDRNPKNLVLQNGYLWFSQAVNCNGRSAVQWHQIKLDGSIIQTGLIKSDTSNYIQTTIAVNKNNDVLVGFQETHADMFISPRMAFRYAKDPKGELRDIVSLGEGKGPTDGVAWGDYSGSIIDGDNLTDLWTIQSITNDKGKGETVIVKVPF